MLLALCDFPSRGAVSTGSGEGSRLEGRPGTPLLVYLGSSQSEAYSSDCRPLSRCGGLSPGAAAANGCLSSCNMNTAASADCLQLPPKVCAVEQSVTRRPGPWIRKAHSQPLPLAGFQTQSLIFTLAFSFPFPCQVTRVRSCLPRSQRDIASFGLIYHFSQNSHNHLLFFHFMSLFLLPLC